MNLRHDDPIPEHRLSLLAIIDAVATIDPVFLQTPQFENETLSDRLGCNLILKVETANPIRSFKGRGADYFIQKVVAREEPRQLVCASTGNFGQAMAYAGRSHGRSVIVHADENANPLKLARIRDLGAEVHQVGTDFDAAKDAAREFCAATGGWMIEDGREPEISEGAGTIAIEVLENLEVDVFVVPVGNAALVNGIARWAKAASPETRVVGVSAASANSMELSWRKGHVIATSNAATIAEGIAVRTPVPEAVDDMGPIVDDMVLVTDDDMIEAMRLILAHTGQLVEPSGAVGVAAIANDPDEYAGRQVATVLTGNNLTPEQIERWLS